MLSYVLLCYAILGHAIPCYVLLCCDVPPLAVIDVT